MSGLKYSDRVQETTTTTGTGTITMLGAVNDYQSFNSAFATGDQVYYVITDNTANWEVGLGTFTSPETLSRDKVIHSSNAGALVNFPAGTKFVFVTEPAPAIADMAMTSAFKMCWVPR